MNNITPGGEFFGVKLAILVAGFFGAVVSLSFVRGLTKPQIAASIVCGMSAANYLTPVAMHYLKIPVDIELGAAFLVGLTAMNVIPAILKISETSNIVAMIRARLQLPNPPKGE